jgi:two-component system, cell cycle response regulator DivK
MSKSVLVVDDFDDSREVLQLLFRRAGFTVFVAANGAQAVLSAKRHHPHAIVMDLLAPVMDGLEATRRIKADPELMHTPIVAYSATASSAKQEAHLFAGICSKPCSPDFLIAMVNKVMTAAPDDICPASKIIN